MLITHPKWYNPEEVVVLLTDISPGTVVSGAQVLSKCILSDIMYVCVNKQIKPNT